MRKYLLYSLLLVFLAVCTILFFTRRSAVPKNVILFIGDGMGVSHITAGKTVKGVLNLERFKTLGLLTTHSQNAFVTDSAAAGTALATGHKTYNGAVSVSIENKPLKTIVEYAEENGKATGLVVTCSLTHATPAAFVSHVKNRNDHTAIAEHIVNSGIDVMFGGGWAYFVQKSADGSKRNDNKDLIMKLSKRMKVILSVGEFRKLNDIDSVAGFFAPDHLPKVKDREFSLAELTEKAIKILSKNSKGFFLMVEGSQIDWEAHNNNRDYIITELTDFDNAVGIGMDFALRNNRTLVLVTADHETGGFAVHDGSIVDKKITASGFTTKNHTASMVPIFAYGPGSSAFSGIHDNTIVGKTIIEYLQPSDYIWH